MDCLLAAVNHRPLHEPRGSHGSFPHRHSHSSLRPTVVCPPSQIPTGLNGHTTPGGAVNLDRASADLEYEVAIYQVIESRVVCWSRLPLGAGGYTRQQLQGLSLKTYVLHSLAHSIRPGRANPQSQTIQARPDKRDELSTRLPEPVTHRPRRHLLGHRHATALRHGRHGPGRSSAARLVRSAHQTSASSTLGFPRSANVRPVCSGPRRNPSQCDWGYPVRRLHRAISYVQTFNLSSVYLTLRS